MSSWRDNVLENLCLIYHELGPSNVGRTYLTLVYKLSDFCETGDAFIKKKVSSETSFKRQYLYSGLEYQTDFRLDFFHYLICNKI
jgi:hypothetical protein